MFDTMPFQICSHIHMQVQLANLASGRLANSRVFACLGSIYLRLFTPIQGVFLGVFLPRKYLLASTTKYFFLFTSSFAFTWLVSKYSPYSFLFTGPISARLYCHIYIPNGRAIPWLQEIRDGVYLNVIYSYKYNLRDMRFFGSSWRNPE